MPAFNCRVLLVCLVASGGLAAPSEPATFTCGSNDVGCLIDAINQANANGKTNTITLAEGPYTLTIVDNEENGPTGLPVITSRLSIVGTGSGATIVERAADAPPFRIFEVASNGQLTLRKLTVRHGSTVNSFLQGAGVLALGTVRVIDSVVTECNVPSVGLINGYGGGIAGGTVEIIRSTISHNRSTSGGGVYVGPGGSLTVKQSAISQNAAFGGGGGVWFASEGRLTIEDSLLDGNEGVYYGPIAGGGGLFIGAPESWPGFVGGATVTIRDSTISHNIGADYGGAMVLFDPAATVLMTHSTIAENRGTQSVGGFMVLQGALTLVESTVARNTAYFFGNTAWEVRDPARMTVRSSTVVENQNPGGTPPYRSTLDTTLENTIVALNTPSATCYPFTSLGHNVIADSLPCVQPQSTDITADPSLGSYIDPGRPGKGHYPLLAGSLAIDAGDDDACGRTDQLGLKRSIDGDGDGLRGCDIGAVEFYPVVNDLVSLERVRTDYVPPDPSRINPLAPAGEYRIEMTYRNDGGSTLCHIGFELVTLTQTGYPPPALLDNRGALIGYQGAVLPASLAGGDETLKMHQRDKYVFRIGVSQKAPIEFNLNVLGESNFRRCKADH
jgi:hypothetical protein